MPSGQAEERFLTALLGLVSEAILSYSMSEWLQREDGSAGISRLLLATYWVPPVYI